MQHFRECRHLTAQDVQIRREEEAWRATLVNATATGMRLKSAAPLKLDDAVTVTGGSWSVGAVVVWLKDGSVGLRLDTPMAAPLLARLTGRAMRLNRKSRVGFGYSSL